MLLLKEVSYADGEKTENKILINPYLITTIRQSGIYTSLATLDRQDIKLSNTFFEIKKMLSEYGNLSVDFEGRETI